jgi:hypothetical protein
MREVVSHAGLFSAFLTVEGNKLIALFFRAESKYCRNGDWEQEKRAQEGHTHC